MKRISFICIIVLYFLGSAIARPVKFSTDITNLLLNYEIQFGVMLELNSNTDSTVYVGMEKEIGNIYSVTLDLPANKIYKFKFSDGDVGYLREVVPFESRVNCRGCDQNYDNDTVDDDNSRWIYVDSIYKPQITSIAPQIANKGQEYSYKPTIKAVRDDTVYTGAILFGENAPMDMYLVRFKVDMKYQPVSAAGVHVAGSFQGWDLNSTKLVSFPLQNDIDGDGVFTFYNTTLYEGIAFVSSGTKYYKFYQGNTVESSEIVPSACGTGGMRTFSVNAHTVLDTVCFSACTSCSGIPIGAISAVTSTPEVLTPLTYTLSNAPVGMVVNGNKVLWTPGDETTSGQVTLTVSNGLFSDSQVFSVDVNPTTKVSNVDENEVKVFPTLCKQNATIQVGTALEGGEISVVSSFGKEVKHISNISGNQLRLEREKLACGVYYIIASKDGVVISKVKIIFE